MKKIGKTNWLLTGVLILGTITVFFPLYMALIIAFKKPSEMTNDVAGSLTLPEKFSFSNFSKAMEVTDFWHSLSNSLLITVVTIILAILIHSIAGYVIGRSMNKKKGYKLTYFYIVSGMFVPFFNLNDASRKTNSSNAFRKSCWRYYSLFSILYANEYIALFRIYEEYSYSS